jgi:hypothetical protein
MENNKTGKYLKYALGEIALVVIGILFALQINNWNEARKDRIDEVVLLEQLQSEYQSNLQQLDEKITMRNDMINASLTMLEYLDDPSTRVKDSVLVFMNTIGLYPTFDPIVNDLNSSGLIQLLSNNRLKELLSLFTFEIVQVTEEEDTWGEYSNTYLIPFLMDKHLMRNTYNEFWKSNTMRNFHLEKGKVVDFDLGESKRKVDLDVIFEDPYLEDHLATCATFAKLINSQSITLRKRIVEILDVINQELSI